LRGDSSQAGRAWTQLLRAKESDPHDLQVLTALGYLAQSRGNSALAMELYREALKLNPIDVTATNNLAILLAKSGQLTDAETLWQKTFDLNEDIDEPGINL
jgi:Flp pilus assembly protein TadD